jgi:hypothetical protein
MSDFLNQIALDHEVRYGTVIEIIKNSLNNIHTSGVPKTNLNKILNALGDFQQYQKDIAEYEQIINTKPEVYTESRPKADRQFDQFFATPKTVFDKISLISKASDFYNRSICILGDDDLLSLSIASLNQAKKITVFEIDPRICDYIKSKNDKVEVIKHDLKNPIPISFKNQFDLIITDPPYTTTGVGLFLNRGIELLKPLLTSRIYLSCGTSDRARERELLIQNEIFTRGLLINHKYFQFNTYLGAESIGNCSSLYILDWTPKTKTIKIESDSIYTNQ